MLIAVSQKAGPAGEMSYPAGPAGAGNGVTGSIGQSGSRQDTRLVIEALFLICGKGIR